MNDSISMFIDDELNLEEKITFVKKVHDEEEFYRESVDLLEQERLLRSDIVSFIPEVPIEKTRKTFGFSSFPSFIQVARFGAVAAIILLLVFNIQLKKEDTVKISPQPASVTKRFVLYRPDASSVEISGSFTGWTNVPLKMVGPSGYWEIELNVVRGEHKYVFIVGEDNRIADPTILMRERDDFGSENSVLLVEA